MIIVISPSQSDNLIGHRSVELEEFGNEQDVVRAMVLVVDALHAYGFELRDILRAAVQVGSQSPEAAGNQYPPDGVGLIKDN